VTAKTNDGEDDSDGRLTDALIESGGDFAGAAVGGAIGVLGGPIGIVGGAAAGVAVTKAVKRVGAEVQERVLAPRQRERAGRALAVAVGELRDDRDPPRSDGFFDTRANGERSDAEELLEGVLLRAMNAYQERKVPYMGRFFASIAKRPDISPAYAHVLLRIMDEMTYRQFVALAYLAENLGSQEFLDLAALRDEQGPWPLPDGFDRELKELGEEMGLIGIRQKDGTTLPAAGTWGGGDLTRHDLSTVTLSDIGQDLYDLLGLSHVPNGEKLEIRDLLRGAEGDQPGSI
jgi:hypothetical protein